MIWSCSDVMISQRNKYVPMTSHQNNGIASTPEPSNIHVVFDLIWPHDDIEGLKAFLSIPTNKYLIDVTHGSVSETPLHWAARNGCIMAADILIQKGAGILKKNNLGQTPLHIAAYYNQCAVVKMLLDSCKIQGILSCALSELDNHIPTRCVTSGRHVPSSGNPVSKMERSNSLLKVAQSKSTSKLNLMQKKIDVLLSQGETAFHYACRAGATECLELLINNGADINSPGCNGEPPLLIACNTGVKDSVDLLLAAGVPVSTVNSLGQTALHIASGSGHQDSVACIQLILDNNADTTIRDHLGQTAAHYAVSVGSLDVLKLLMDYGTPLTLTKNIMPAEAQERRLGSKGRRLLQDHPSNIIVTAARCRTSQCLNFLLEKMLEIRRHCFLRKLDPSPYNPTHMEQEVLSLFPTLLERTPEGGSTLQLAMSRSPQITDSLLDGCIGCLPGEKNFGLSDNPKVFLDLILFKSPSWTTEIMLLLGLTHRARQQVFNHPLVQIFLALKWTRVRYLYWILIVLHLVFLLVVAVRVVVTHGQMLGPIRAGMPYYRDMQVVAINYSRWILVALICIMALLELLKISRAGFSRYFRWDDNGREHLLNWVVILMAILEVTDLVTGSWSRVTGAMLVLVVCFQMLQVMSRFPYIGIYVVMISRVIRSVSTFLFAYIWLYIGFGLAFHVLLYQNPELDNSNPVYSLLKVVVMFVGEYGFPQAFQSEDEVLMWSANILLAISVPTMTVLLLNLIIGLTVTDMRHLFQQAHYHRQVILAQLILYLSALLPSGGKTFVTEDIRTLQTVLTVELSVYGDEADADLRVESAESVLQPTAFPDQSAIVHSVELSEYTVEKLRRCIERQWGYSGAFYQPISPSSTFPSRTPTPTSSISTSDNEVEDSLEHLQKQQREAHAYTVQLHHMTAQLLNEVRSLKTHMGAEGAANSRPETPSTVLETPTLEDPPQLTNKPGFNIKKPTPTRRRQWTSISSYDTNLA